MPTIDQIDEQIKLEREAIASGLSKLRKQASKLEQQSYASATIYGVCSIETMLPLVTEEIENTVNYRLYRKAGQNYKEIMTYLKDMDSLAAAAIGCKVIFDKVFGPDDKSSYASTMSIAIGQALENECQMTHYETNAPGLLNLIKKNYYHSSMGTQQKLVVVRTLMNRCGVTPWKSWGNENRSKLGAWLIDCVCKATGWFDKAKTRVGNKTPTLIFATPAFLEIKDKVIANSELFSPEAWPMLVEPNDWTESKPGGYLLNEVMRGHQFVRVKTDHPLIQGENPYAFVNKIQKVQLRINPDILEVAEYLMERGRTVKKFIPTWREEPEPSKPPDIGENKESRKAYCRAKAAWHNRLNDNAKRSVRTRKVMEMARRFKNVDKFYLPWSLDYRGRAYPIPAFLTPQETDFGKSLLLFAEPAFMTPEAEEWLAFQVATTYGLDKACMSDRLEWVANNHKLITHIAEDPIGNIHLWENTDEPWQFLAACGEYFRCCISCTDDYTSLPVATDATCSGLQILAGLARDKSTAQMVNVIPGDKPQDAYRAVAELAKPNIPEQWREHVDRSVAKRLVMTIPYNAKFGSNWGYVKDALNDPLDDGGKALEVPKEDVTLITHALREAVFQLFPGPTAVMRWIEKEVANVIKSGVESLEWVTPSGFIATQRFMKVEMKRLDLQLLGRVRMNIAIGETAEVDLKHHKTATSPNLIHSLDASLLHLATLRFDAPIALIHDSVLCRATDMSVLSTLVRETYMHMFADQDYLTSWGKQIGATTPPPIIGDLEPSSVIESTYFFC